MYRYGLVLGLLIALTMPFDSVSSDAGAPSAEVDEAIPWLRHIRARLRSVFSIRADFVQEYLPPSADAATETATGHIELRRGGRVRMTFDTPDAAVLVSNADETWFFDKGSRTAYHLNSDATLWWPGLAEAFLSPNILEAFSAMHLGGARSPAEAPHTAALKFTPNTPDRFVDAVVLTVDACPPFIRRITVLTTHGGMIRTTLKNAKTNVGIGARRFTFSPPGRVRTIEQ